MTVDEVQPGLGTAACAEVSLLGGFRLTTGGRPVRLPTSSQRIVAFAALRGACPRSHIAGSLWPDAPEARALARLRTALWRTHQAASHVLVVDPDAVAPSPCLTVDVSRLRALAREVADGPPGSDQNLALVEQGDLLPNWDDDWLRTDRDRLRQLRLYLLESLAVRLANRGSFAVAMDVALAALSADPLRESAHRAVIRVHLAEGNLGDAISAYERCCRLMGRELGVRPSPETTALVDAAAPDRHVVI